MAGEPKGGSGLGSFFGARPALSFALIAILAAGVFSTALTMVLQRAYAGTLDDLVVTPNDGRTGVTTVYTITAKTDTKGFIEAVEIDFPAAYAIADCASPCGTYTLVEIKKLRNDGDFSAVAADDTITYTMPRVSSLRAGAQFSMTIEGIVNPTDAESHSITVSTLDRDGNTIDSDTVSVTISSSLSASDADDGLTIENTGGSITIDASDDLNLEADGTTIKLNALDDAESEIEITDSIAGAGGGTVTLNAALSTQTLTITGATPTLTFDDTGGAAHDAAIMVDAGTMSLQTDNAAGAATTRLSITGASDDSTYSISSSGTDTINIGNANADSTTINAGTVSIGSAGIDTITIAGDAGADTVNIGNDANAAIDTINLLTGADGTADVFNLGGTGADDINIGSATSVLSIASTQLNVADTGDISDTGGDVVISDTFQLGAAGSSLTAVKLATFTFDDASADNTETIADAFVTSSSVVIVSIDNDLDNTCSVNNIVDATSFDIDCTANVADGVTGQYVIIK